MFKLNPILSGETGRIKEPEYLHDMMRWYQGTTLERIDAVKGACPDARRFMQHLADDVVDVLGKDVWNDALWLKIQEHVSHSKAYATIGDTKVVLTRLSLPYEAHRLHEEGGKLVRVNRPDFGPANDHPNEIALDSFTPDAVINNGGTVEELLDNVRYMEANLW
jgi:hypothetical protein